MEQVKQLLNKLSKEEIRSLCEVTREEFDSIDWDENGAKYNKDGKRLLTVKGDLKGTFAIKKGTQTICDDTFICCAGLTSISIPSSVTNIGGLAFYRY